MATTRSISGAARRHPFPLSLADPLTRRLEDIIAIASSGLGRSLQVERLTIYVEELSRQETRNRPVPVSASARRIPVEPVLESFPEFSGKNRSTLLSPTLGSTWRHLGSDQVWESELARAVAGHIVQTQLELPLRTSEMIRSLKEN